MNVRFDRKKSQHISSIDYSLSPSSKIKWIMGILVTQHSMKNYKSRINKEIYLISGNVGTNFTLLFNLEKRYNVTEGAMN